MKKNMNGTRYLIRMKEAHRKLGREFVLLLGIK